ncbi:hypothetical protein Q3H58_001149 [Pseudomonas psychrotolerans]|nr:hypothetical protein [Pseudomonas psychrotolerans]
MGQGAFYFLNDVPLCRAIGLHLVQAQREDLGEGAQHLDVTLVEPVVGLETQAAQGAIDPAFDLDRYAQMRADWQGGGRRNALGGRKSGGVGDQLRQFAIDDTQAITLRQRDDLPLLEWTVRWAVHMFEHPIRVPKARQEGHVHPQVLAYHAQRLTQFAIAYVIRKQLKQRMVGDLIGGHQHWIIPRQQGVS